MQIAPEGGRRLFDQFLRVDVLPGLGAVVLRYSCAPQVLCLGLGAADPDVLRMIKEHQACLVLHELYIHSQNLYLMHHLQIVSNLVAVLEASRLRILQLQGEIVVAKLLEVVLDRAVVPRPELGPSVLRLELRLLPALLLRLWLPTVTYGRESELERLPEANLRLRSHLYAGQGVPELIVPTHATIFLRKLGL